MWHTSEPRAGAGVTGNAWARFFINHRVTFVKTVKLFLSGLLVMLAAGSALADRAADEAAIRKSLGHIEAAGIEPSPVAGIYEVTVGTHIVYMSADGRYMFQGDLIDVPNRQSLTEPRRREAIKALIAGVSEDDMIIFEPKKTRHTITVFTDIDCGYCRKLHGEINTLLDAGIRVRYMFFPRAGVGSNSYKKAVAVWCADDRKAALTAAKNNQPIDMKSCDNPLAEHMELVDKLGARGTPFIVLENGKVQPGYVPAPQMIKMLDQIGAQ
jgi:thiol:disulfide interchange protein DsbC